MQQQPVSACGCTLRSYACEIGRQLAIDLFCGDEVINSPHFLSRPEAERIQLLLEHQCNVQQYRRHCEGVSSEQGGLF